MAKTDKKNAKQDKTKGSKKAKGKRKGKGKAGAADGVSVAGHPRAAASVRRAKGLGGIACFFIAAYVSYKAGVPPDQVAMRALASGIAGYLLAWACSVSVWRHLVLAELRAAVEDGRATLEPPPDRTAPAPSVGKAEAAGE